MKRYNCTVGDKRGEFGDCMEVKPDGDWVRYSKVLDVIGELQKQIDSLKRKKDKK